jgi:hypothetical protein
MRRARLREVDSLPKVPQLDVNLELNGSVSTSYEDSRAPPWVSMIRFKFIFKAHRFCPPSFLG